MNYCDICYRESMTRLCAECANWDTYWNSLSPEGKREEVRMMDQYVGEKNE